MSVNRKRASITGVLFIVATVVDQLSTVLTKPVSIVMILLILPIAVQEMVTALWLLIKGFNPSVFPSSSAPVFQPSSKAAESV